MKTFSRSEIAHCFEVYINTMAYYHDDKSSRADLVRKMYTDEQLLCREIGEALPGHATKQIHQMITLCGNMEYVFRTNWLD